MKQKQLDGNSHQNDGQTEVFVTKMSVEKVYTQLLYYLKRNPIDGWIIT